MYGAGIAYEISPSFDIRAEYRGFVVQGADLRRHHVCHQQVVQHLCADNRRGVSLLRACGFANLEPATNAPCPIHSQGKGPPAAPPRKRDWPKSLFKNWLSPGTKAAESLLLLCPSLIAFSGHGFSRAGQQNDAGFTGRDVFSNPVRRFFEGIAAQDLWLRRPQGFAVAAQFLHHGAVGASAFSARVPSSGV
jgi:hypothetical protein